MSRKATIALVTMCKNEEDNIERCIKSARDAGITVATILDTGSTDGTIERIHKACEGMDLRLHQSGFVDFGTARSELLSYAIGSGDLLLLLDADMTVEIDEDFDPDMSTAPDAYDLEIGSDTGQGALPSQRFSYQLPLLVRGDRPWISVGAVHEAIRRSDANYTREPNTKVHIKMSSIHRASMEKNQWHAKLLRQSLNRNPDDSRAVFYLAQTLRLMGQNKKSRDLYIKRTKMGGWDEEIYYASFSAAAQAEDWLIQMKEYMSTWELRPFRLEALHSLVRLLNQQGLHHAAYALSNVPLIPPPPTELLFVHLDVWDWGMTFERSIAAWWVGNKDECKTLCDELLTKQLPENVREAVEKNRSFC